MDSSFSQSIVRRYFSGVVLSLLVILLGTGCTHRKTPDVALIPKDQTRTLRFSRISVDMSDLKLQMSQENYTLLGNSLQKALASRFNQQMGGHEYHIIVRLTDLSLRMLPTREHEMDQSNYMDGQAYIIGPNNTLVVRKHVLMASTGSNSIIPWPTTCFTRKQIVIFANEYAAWIHRSLVGGSSAT